MEYSMVIKVKYGDTLRRFSVPVNEKKQLDLDMDRLKGKILSLFNFPLDADPILTYIDEDDDVVTLADDNDLCDVMSQRLKFLRIDVRPNDGKSDNSSASGGCVTPTRSPQTQKPLANISVGVNEVLKSIPEPLYEKLSKLSLDLALKDTSSSPVLADLLEYFSKMSHSYLNPVSQSIPDSSTHRVSSAGLNAPLGSKDAYASKDCGSQEVLRKSNLATEQSKKVEVENMARGVGAPNLSEAMPVDLDVNPHVNAPTNDDTRVRKEIDGHLIEESVGIGLPDMAVKPSNVVVRAQNTELIGNLANECPFSGMTVNNQSAIPFRVYPRFSSFKRSNNRYDAAVGMFHKGVRCDGCGVHPITGPRFKSKVKEDYDLCSICFSEMGNEADYIRMDRPQTYRHPQSVQGLDCHPRVAPHKMRQFLKSVSVKPARSKLDSCFISDVNVSDGTVMAPSTSFSKIWRMRNCGESVWPQGSQLVWIGGDRFSSAISVNVEIPADGVPVDGELDIAVDFIAPQLPGQYLSYWRMATPAGVKFGQRVWVLIKVDAALKDAFCGSFQDTNLNVTPQDAIDGYEGLNLNYPPVGGSSKPPQMLDMNVLPVGDFVSSLSSDNAATEPAKPGGVEQPKGENAESNFPINDALLVGSSASALPAPLRGPSELDYPVSYPIIDLSEATGPVPISTDGTKVIDEVEKALLRELEMMGFKQVDLNKEILRRNGYNLEQSVDDICGDAEWDTILQELQEMGFCNEEVNKRLLKKNNGSIKHVVMELLSGWDKV